MLVNILLFVALAYLVGRTLALHYEKKADKLHAELVTVKTKRQQEKEKYERDMRLYEQTLKNYKGY
jgi:hypothetical protein